MNRSETILVRLPNWVGDVIMATPALRALRTTFPDARIIGLGKLWAPELLDDHPCFDEVLGFGFQAGKSDPKTTFGLIQTIRKRKPAWGLLFPNSFGSALLFFLARVPQRIGYNTNGRGLFLTRGIKTPDKTLHQLDYFLGLTAGFSKQTAWDRTLYFPVSPQRKEEADRLWQAWDVDPAEVVVGLNPGAAWGRSKRWLPEYFAKTADLFHQERGAKIVIFGGPEDVLLAEQIAGLMQAPSLIIAGKDNLRVLPALLGRCNLFITNDTGPMHIAESQKVPQVVLFGPTDPRQTAYVRENARVLLNKLDCAPCFKPECPYGHHNCMVGISPAQVFDAGSQLLDGRF